jgi:hypothetical protein
MQIVIDTVCIAKLIKNIGPIRDGGKKIKPEILGTPLDIYLMKGQVIVLLDNVEGLKGEWENTCGKEYIEEILTQWNDNYKSVVKIEPVRSIGYPHSKKLKMLGFKDNIDRLVIRIALSANERNIISDDPDFWDPNDKNVKGDPNACVAKLCRESLGITNWLLDNFLQILAS